MGALLGRRLCEELGEHPAVIEIRGRGLFYGLEITCSRDAVVMEALQRDMWVYPAGSGPVAEAVIVAPPFVVTESEIDEIVNRLRDSLDAALAG
jgi:adenosylmethionine-8-amino-7-oxononanoate aminotransferase